MKIYDKIFIQYFDDDGEHQEDIHWCEDRQFDGDIEYTLSTPQPIETAPMGDLVLLFCDIPYCNWCVGYFDKYIAKWVINSMDNEQIKPTHWLPQPPKPETK